MNIDIDSDSSESIQKKFSSSLIEISSNESMEIDNGENNLSEQSEFDNDEDKLSQLKKINQMKIDPISNQKCEWNKEEAFTNNEFQEDSINYTEFGKKDYAQHYFLKIINNDNSCYANSIIQAILALGDKLFKIISNDNGSEFSIIMSYFIEPFLRISNATIS